MYEGLRAKRTEFVLSPLGLQAERNYIKILQPMLKLCSYSWLLGSSHGCLIIPRLYLHSLNFCRRFHFSKAQYETERREKRKSSEVNQTHVRFDNLHRGKGAER